MPRKKKGFNLPSKIKTALRTLSVYWPPRKEARKLAEHKIVIGHFKTTGRPKTITKYECADCGGLFNRDETQVDHKIPVIDPDIGFTSWDDYIARLFVESSSLQVLCNTCHNNKSQKENKKRRKKT